jgi:copper resistance protein B
MSPADAAPLGPPVQDQRVYAHALLEQFEYRAGGSDSVSRWDGEAWLGTDTNRLWIRSEGEVNRHGEVADGQQELLYDRPITSFFDLQTGLRLDLDSAAGRAWAAIGVEGLAPEFLHVSAAAYAGDGGRFAAKLQLSCDELVTQRWILQPELELNAYSADDPSRRIGSGVSDLDAGLRLRYEIHRKLAPYLGLGFRRAFARTAQYARADGDPAGTFSVLLGIRTWF